MVRLDHIGIAVHDIESGRRFWELMGLSATGEVETNDEQGVKLLFLPLHRGEPPQIELLEATAPETPIGRFIENRGAGVQQLAFEVDDLVQTITKLTSAGVEMIDSTPKSGAHGSKIAFVHPKSTGGVLVELVEK